MSWPNTDDGDVFRRLEAAGFDFSKEWPVDYDVDFSTWPPAKEAMELLTSKYPNVEFVASIEDFSGYGTFQIVGKLDYATVVATQRDVSLLMSPFGGVCESWGVLH